MTHDNIDILVVDDDISHCTILQALLRGWGYNVALANSGRPVSYTHLTLPTKA